MAFDLSALTSVFKKNGSFGNGDAVIGVDVGASSIKIVQLELTKGVPTLTTYGELQLGPYDNVEIGRSVQLPVLKLTEAFVDIVREASADAELVSLGISYNSSFSTVIAIPPVAEDKIAPMVNVEARKYIPVPLNEVALDWFPVSSPSGRGQMNILLAAIHQDAIKRYDLMISQAGLIERFKEIEFFSTMRSVLTRESENVAIIDLGARSTKLYIVNRGLVAKTHSVLLNGVDLTNELMKSLSLDFLKAEEEKRARGIGKSANPLVQKALTELLERGMREMHKVMSRYEEESGNTIQKVILSGSGAMLLGIQSYVSDLMARPVERANPFSKVAYPAFLEDTLIEAGPSFSVAVGAALRAFV